MKKVAYAFVLAAGMASSSVMAADMAVKAPPAAAPPPSPWDIVVTAALMTDYNFRGISQSNHKPSTQAGFEVRYNWNANWQSYGGISGESINFPNNAAAEIDFYGGIRPTFDKLALDFGAWYYYYPGGQCFSAGTFTFTGVQLLNGAGACNSFSAGGNFQGAGSNTNNLLLPNGNAVKANVSFWEIYGKGTYTVNDSWSFGGQVFYSPSVSNSGAWGTYVAGTLKYTAPMGMPLPKDVGFYASVDAGYWWLGTSDAFYGVISPGHPNFVNGVPYTSFANVDFGIGFTWKVFTLDIRGYWSGLNKGDCNAFTSDHTALAVGNATAINPGPPTGNGFGSNWCSPTAVVKLSSDLTLANVK
jgi:uncharacterized protein (TIGR02001 family)